MSAFRKLGWLYLAAGTALAVVVLLAELPASHRALPGSPPPRLQFFWLPEQIPKGPRAPESTVGGLAATPVAPAHSTRAEHHPVRPERGTELSRLRSARVVSSNRNHRPEDPLALVEQRLRQSLTRDLYDHFELFLYVSKAAFGPWAQHMYVFQEHARGRLIALYDWPVSTGRERIEYNSSGVRLPSYTPSGFYEFDPNRFFRHHFSSQWHRPMPFAMFFNAKQNGNLTGVAIHSAIGDEVAELGTRASAGCIRLSPEAARTLFTLIRTRYRGLAPRFAIDRRTGTMSRDGIVLHDAGGQPELAEGYKVLVIIEDYGGQNFVAAMY
jgi:hypothetical protein